MQKPGLFVGAYAAYATLQTLSRESELDFLHALHQCNGVRGLELPFGFDFAKQDPESFLAELPSDWEYIITLLPGTMQSLQEDAHYGLASHDRRGREAALKRCELARQRIIAWQDQLGRQAVIAVHLHSAPRLGQSGVTACGEALQQSLESLLSRDWGGAALVLEHCDAYRLGQLASKGFLSLEQELKVVEALGIGLTINWGRSVLETRRLSGAREHIAQALAAKVLRGVFFSGTSPDDPLYGVWQDNHAPIILGNGKVWEPQQGLLCLKEVQRVLELVQGTELSYFGLKVQPFPARLSWSERLECLKDHLDAFQTFEEFHRKRSCVVRPCPK